MGLDDPPKPTNEKWMITTTRTAYVVLRVNRTTHEITLDLTKSSKNNPKIITNKVYHGNGYPMLTSLEQNKANKLAQGYGPFTRSISKRGLKIDEIVCLGFSVGWYGEKKKKKKKKNEGRIVKVMCFTMDGTINFYMRPIEGVTVTVDLDEMKVVGFKDRIVVRVPKGEGTDYRETMQNRSSTHHLPTKGVIMTQPNGPSFNVDGHVV
ncbi:hypothetical protein SOVF_177450, partial [Spinacia oleracea]